MDHDTVKLVQSLCCRAGMLMEDTSVLAVTTSSEDELQKTVMELDDAIDRMHALVAAAKSLIG